MQQDQDPEDVAMTLAAVMDSRSSLVGLLHDLEAPEGLRIEVIGGLIVMSPVPRAGHGAIIKSIDRQLSTSCPSGSETMAAIELLCARTEQVVIPDLVVLPTRAIEDDLAQYPADVCDLVVEVTSPSTAHNDRKPKRIGYASEGIPFYLLVDRLRASVTLFSDPKDGDYQAALTAAFGSPVHIPAPFAVALDTSGFPRDPNCREASAS